MEVHFQVTNFLKTSVPMLLGMESIIFLIRTAIPATGLTIIVGSCCS